MNEPIAKDVVETDAADAAASAATETADPTVETLVEDVSIDGMCGVY